MIASAMRIRWSRRNATADVDATDVGKAANVLLGSLSLLFVPAGVEHRFEHFSEDFSTWVVFYGPRGGETA